MGIDTLALTIGIDLLHTDRSLIPGRAIMSYYEAQAYMQDERVVITKLDEVPKIYERTESGLIESSDQNPNLINRALGIAT